MKRIDTSKWKEFLVGKLFVTEKDGKQVPTGASIPKLELKENGSTPRISVTGINNGILGYFDYVGSNVNNYRVYHNFVSVSFLGTIFYQKGSASLDMKVHCLKPLNVELNEYTGSFLVAAIKASLKNYAYSDQLSSTVLPNVCIKLPATPSNEPDWEFMENYMRKYEQQTSTSIKSLKQLTDTHKPKQIETSNWKEFEIEKIFSVIRPIARLATEYEDGEIPFVASGNVNNGVEKYVKSKGEILDTKGCISVSPVDGSCFYQPVDFLGRGGAGSSIILLRNEHLKEYSALFVCSVIKKVCSKYSYSNMGSVSTIRKEKINLPATPSGEPDWNLMEQYMRQVEQQVKNTIIALTTPTPQVQQQTNLVNYGTVNIYER